MEKHNPIKEIRSKMKLTVQEAQALEDEFITTDLHELAKREAWLTNKVFHDSYFEGLEILYDKMGHFESLLVKTGPLKHLVTIDNILTKVAVIILYFLIFLGCTSSS